MIPLLLLAAALAGCIDPSGLLPPQEESPICTQVSIPSVRAGAEYVYEARGTFALAGSDSFGFVAWEAVDPNASGDDQGALMLPAGSRIRVAVGEDLVPVSGPFGHVRDAYQVTYWATVPDRPGPVPFADQWLDAETGRLLSWTTRYVEVRQGDVNHLTGASRWNATGLLQGPLLWNDSLRAGDENSTATLVFPVGPISLATGRVRYEVQSVTAGERGCRAAVRVADTGSSPVDSEGPPDVAELVLREDRSLPTRYAFREPGQPASFEMRLLMARPGDGETLPVLETAPLPETALKRAPADGVAPAGGEEVWPTSYPRAKQVAENDTATDVWLRVHPEARVAVVRHKMGHANSSIVDSWTLVWTTPAGDRKGVVVERDSEGGGTTDNDSYDAHDHREYGEIGYPPAGQRRVTLGAMASLRAAVYGEPPEFFQCYVGEGTCRIGTHEGTRRPPACGGGERCDGGGVRFGSPGLYLDVVRGRVLSMDSYDPDALPPPAGRDSG